MSLRSVIRGDQVNEVSLGIHIRSNVVGGLPVRMAQADTSNVAEPNQTGRPSLSLSHRQNRTWCRCRGLSPTWSSNARSCLRPKRNRLLTGASSSGFLTTESPTMRKLLPRVGGKSLPARKTGCFYLSAVSIIVTRNQSTNPSSGITHTGFREGAVATRHWTILNTTGTTRNGLSRRTPEAGTVCQLSVGARDSISG